MPEGSGRKIQQLSVSQEICFFKTVLNYIILLRAHGPDVLMSRGNNGNGVQAWDSDSHSPKNTGLQKEKWHGFTWASWPRRVAAVSRHCVALPLTAAGCARASSHKGTAVSLPQKGVTAFFETLFCSSRTHYLIHILKQMIQTQVCLSRKRKLYACVHIQKRMNLHCHYSSFVIVSYFP